MPLENWIGWSLTLRGYPRDRSANRLDLSGTGGYQQDGTDVDVLGTASRPPSPFRGALLPYDAHVLALTLDAAKNVAIAVAAIFVIGAVLSAWLMKTIIQKVATALVLAVLAFAVWSQRTSLQDCADKVSDAYDRNGSSVTFLDTECSFFGATITISDPRDDAPDDAG